MKKRTIGIIIGVIFSIMFCSCRTVPGEPETDESVTYEGALTNNPMQKPAEVGGIALDYFKQSGRTATIIQNEPGIIFFAKEDGIYRYDGEHAPDRLTDFKFANNLLYNNGKLFFTDQNEKILYFLSNGEEKEQVYLDISNEKDGDISNAYICPYDFHNNILIFGGASGLYYYEPEPQKITQISQAGADNWQLKDGNIDYIDHATKTFSIYRYNLQTNQTQVLLGADYKENRIQMFAWLEDQLFYYQRMPAGLYCKESDNKFIISDGDIRDVILYHGKIYFSSFYPLETYINSFEENEMQMISTIRKYDPSSGFSIIGNYIYYASGYELLDQSGHLIYDYSVSKPVMQELNN